MADVHRAKLGRILSRFGVVQHVVWNRATGYCVGGHQRLIWLDAKLKGKGDYELPVEVVNIKSEKEEITLMAALNNQQAQGEDDLDKMHGLISAGELDLDLAGFDRTWLETTFPEDPKLSKLFARTPDQVRRSAEKLSEIAAVTAEERKSWRASDKDEEPETDPERYVVVLFDGRRERATVLRRLGLKPSSRYVPWERFREAVLKRAR